MGSHHAASGVRPRIPEHHGEVAVCWGEHGLQAATRSKEELDRGPLGQLRVLARQELGMPGDRPVIAAGHQPALSHPGILLRQRLLTRLGPNRSPLWVIVDSDAPSEISIPIPLLRRRYTKHSLVLVKNPERYILADLPVPSALDRAWPMIAARLTTLRNRQIADEAERTWAAFPPPSGTWATWAEKAKRAAWGLEVPALPVTRLAATEAFRGLLSLCLRDTHKAHAAYTRAARMARLKPPKRDTLPLWTLQHGRRVPARTLDATPLLPQALMLTLAVRALVCDFFIHGAGGAGYEPAVDLFFQELLGIEPPPWGWVVGTFHLPEPSAEERLLDREYPFFLHDPGVLSGALQSVPL